MPGIAPPVGNPYPTIGSVMNVARARVNDMINDADGDLLTNSAPYSQTHLTAAWDWYQGQLATAGVETFIRVITLYDIPARATNDPADEAWVTWLGCSDGVNQYEASRLPMDLILPLKVGRRQAGTQNAFAPMTQAEDGLPNWLNPSVTDWREDGLYFYADTYAQDMQIRYAAFRGPLDITLPDQQVPMMMCANALGTRVGFEFALARGSVQAQALADLADREVSTSIQRSTRRRMRQNLRRKPYNHGR